MTTIAPARPIEPGRTLWQRVTRCMSVSVVTTVISLSTLAVATAGLGMAAWLANVVATAVATGPGYVLNRRWTWGRRGASHPWREIAPFWLLSFCGLALSTATVALADTWAAHAHLVGSARTFTVLVAHLAGFGILWVAQFAILDRFVFGQAPVAVAPTADIGAPIVQRAPVAARPFPVLMVGASLATLLLGLALQLAFVGHGGNGSLSDLPRVFSLRGVGVGPGALPYIQRVVEYPVGAGMLLFVAARMAPSPIGVLVVTAVGSAAVCVAITVVLERRCGSRAWRWAVGTPVFLFAFQNWDMFAIAAMLAGLLAFEHHRDRLAGVALALGAAVKLFPAVLLPPFIALRWAEGDRRGARRLAATGALTFAAVNLPFLLANRDGWWWPFAFQGRRTATWGTAWHWLFRIAGVPVHGMGAAPLANLVSFAALAVGLVWLTVIGVRRHLAPVSMAAASVAIFVLANKVYSPTYDIWLVAFFVLLPFSRRLWLTFCAVDLAVYAAVYGFFHGVVSQGTVETVLPVLVLVRTAVLLRTIVVATNRRLDGDPTVEAALAAQDLRSSLDAVGRDAPTLRTPAA